MVQKKRIKVRNSKGRMPKTNKVRVAKTKSGNFGRGNLRGDLSGIAKSIANKRWEDVAGFGTLAVLDLLAGSKNRERSQVRVKRRKFEWRVD